MYDKKKKLHIGGATAVARCETATWKLPFFLDSRTIGCHLNHAVLLLSGCVLACKYTCIRKKSFRAAGVTPLSDPDALMPPRIQGLRDLMRRGLRTAACPAGSEHTPFRAGVRFALASIKRC